MADVVTTVRIQGDASSLSDEIDDSIKQIRSLAATVDKSNKDHVAALKDTIALQREYMTTVKATGAQFEALDAITQQVNRSAQQAARQTAVGFENMSRGMMFVASSGNLAGRGMASVVAAASNMAFAFAPSAAWIGGVAIAGLALNAFANHAEKSADKIQKAMDKILESTNRFKVAGLTSELAGQLWLAQTVGADPSKFFAAGQTAYPHNILGAWEAMRDARNLPGMVSQGTLQQQELLKRGAAEDKIGTLRKDLEDAHNEALQRETALIKAQSEGNFVLAEKLRPMIDVQLARVLSAVGALKTFIASPMGGGQMLGLNIDRELAQIGTGEAGFRDAMGKAAGRSAIDLAEDQSKGIDKLVTKIAKNAGDAVDRAVKSDSSGNTAAALALIGLSGFGGSAMANLSDNQFAGIWEAWRTAVKFAPKVKERLPPGGQFTVPDSAMVDPGVHGHPSFLDRMFGVDETNKKRMHDMQENFTELQRFGMVAWQGIGDAASVAIERMVAHHKAAVKAITAALGAPLVKYLEAYAIKEQIEAGGYAVAGDFASAGKAEAESLAAVAGAAAVARITGAGGGGGDGGGGSGGSGSGYGSTQNNRGAALGRGRDDGGQITLEVIVTQKAEDGRQLAQLAQRFQRLDDRNQPNRLIL